MTPLEPVTYYFWYDAKRAEAIKCGFMYSLMANVCRVDFHCLICRYLKWITIDSTKRIRPIADIVKRILVRF